MLEIRCCAVEFREDDSRQSPGLLAGVLLTYGERASDRAEIFLENSLSWPESGVILNVQHDRKQALLRFVPKVEGKEVRVEAPFLNTASGRDAAEMVRAGVYTGLSVEFRAQSERYEGNVRMIEKAILAGAGLVDDPSYSGSGVSVREKGRRAGLRWKPYW